jgi:DUF218 domain
MNIMARYDGILVPGGGVREDGTLPLWVQLRLDRAIHLADGKPILPLSAGTTHKMPPREPNGWPVLEAIAMGRYLVARGYPAEQIWPEAASFDTIGNAFFSRMIHAEPAQLRELGVVTSEFHLARTELTFRWVFSLDPPARPYRLHFECTPDTGMKPDVLEARRAKERDRIEALQTVMESCRSLAGLHRWLYTSHSAYAIAVWSERDQARDKLLDSY